MFIFIFHVISLSLYLKLHYLYLRSSLFPTDTSYFSYFPVKSGQYFKLKLWHENAYVNTKFICLKANCKLLIWWHLNTFMIISYVVTFTYQSVNLYDLNLINFEVMTRAAKGSFGISDTGRGYNEAIFMVGQYSSSQRKVLNWICTYL